MVVDGEAIKGVDTSVAFVDKNITIPGKRWRQGGNLIVWGSNTVHVGTLSDGLHVVARRQDQNCSNGFLGSANCRGNGYLVVDTFQSGTLYASTNIYLTVGAMASDTVVDYTFQSGAVNRTTLDVTNACSGSTTVNATDLAMLPARLSGFAGSVQLTGADARSRFSSGGALLANWTVTLNGAAVDKLPLNGMNLTVMKDATGIWLDVKKSGLWLLFR